MDARKSPCSQEFDAIGAFDVLEHIPEDEVVLHEMFETVKPGGGLFLTVPQHPFLWTEVDEHSMHQRRYTRRELRSKVERAGFRVQRITSFVSLLLPLMIAARFGQKKSRVSEHSWDEFKIHPLLNLVLENVLDVERWMIRVGASLPAGGSLLLVAKKPA